MRKGKSSKGKRERVDEQPRGRSDTVSPITDAAQKNSKIFMVLSVIVIISVSFSLFYFFTSNLTDTLYLSKMSKVNAQAIQEKEEKAKAEEAVGLTVTSVPGVVLQVDQATALKYLDTLDAATIDALLKKTTSNSSASGSTTAAKTTSSNQALSDAYAQAEKDYPGQISASKRLQLINELNAKDYTYYVAEDGDTLLALSAAFNVPLGQLVEINGIHDADVIPAGMIILFPSETVAPAKTTK